MSQKYTAGPWIYDIHEHSFYIFGPDMAMVADGDPDDIGIARIRGTGRGADEHEQEANARLIAAAPALLDACELALTFSRNGCPDPTCNVCKRQAAEMAQIRQAVSVARGL